MSLVITVVVIKSLKIKMGISKMYYYYKYCEDIHNGNIIYKAICNKLISLINRDNMICDKKGNPISNKDKLAEALGIYHSQIDDIYNWLLSNNIITESVLITSKTNYHMYYVNPLLTKDRGISDFSYTLHKNMPELNISVTDKALFGKVHESIGLLREKNPR